MTRDRPVRWAVLAASAAILCWMGRSLVTGEIPFTGDLLHQNYPFRDFYAGALAKGQRVWWMPSIFGGFDVAGEGQLGVFHPLHWLLYRTLPLDRAFAIELVAPYLLLLGGTCLFLRRWIDTTAAVVGAMLFTFSGFALSHGVHMNMVGVVAHIPWLLWTCDRVLRGNGRREQMLSAAAFALLTGSAVLLGHPQALWFAALLVGAYGVFVLTTVPACRHRAPVALLFAGGGLGAGIGAVQILATLSEVQRSTRPLDDVAFATSFSLPPPHLLQLIEPYLLWGRILRWNEAPGAGDEFAVYGGAVALALAAWWMAGGRAHRAEADDARTVSACSGLAWWGLAVAAAGLWLATGSYGRLYYLETWLPIIGGFRAPVRYVLFAHLGLAVVAAVAVTRLAPRSGSSVIGRRAVWAPWLLAAASALGALLVPGPGGTGTQAWLARLAGPTLFVVAASLITAAARGRRFALVTLVLFAAADQALYGAIGVIAWQDFLTRPQAEGYLDEGRAGIPPGDARVARGGFPNLHVLAGYRLIDGYAGLAPKKVLDYRSPTALALAGVKYVHTDFLQGRTVPGATVLEKGWLRLPDPLPRVRLLGDARVSRDPAVDIERVNVSAVALVTRPVDLSGITGQASIVRDDPGEIEIGTETRGANLLVVSESIDEGWTVTIDGQAAVLEPVYGDFFGTVVPAGAHDVLFTYRPPFYSVGRAITLTSLALTLIMGLVGVSRRTSRLPGRLGDRRRS